ncbi:MAG: EAL domain-containing protein [Candidatus Omnitrophica bacterium]|nr:EAL domain-containing protein [Candidatus Omnitrophota bacterium]
MSQGPLRVLVMEDNRDYQLLLEDCFNHSQTSQFSLHFASTLSESLKDLAEENPDIVLMDLGLADSQGVHTFIAVQERYPAIPIVILTALDDRSAALEAVRRGAQDFLHKRDFDLRFLAQILTDAIRRKKAEKVLSESKRRYDILLHTSEQVLYEWDPAKNELSFEGNTKKVLGYARQELQGSLEHWLELIHPEDLPRFETPTGFISARKLTSRLEYRVRRPDGSWVLIEDRGHFYTDPKENITRMTGVINDISQKKKFEEKLNKLSWYDHLTGLPNRMLLIDRLNRAVISARYRKQKLAVLFLELDHFKRINDTFGHSMGDQLLHAVAQRLKLAVQETDTVSRIGGDEFVILLPDLDKNEKAIHVANKIFRIFQSPFFVMGHEFFMNASIGVSFFPDDGQDSGSLLQNADTAMNGAKEKGRAQYQLYSSSMNSKLAERFELENELRHAVDRDELKVFYQPQVDLKTGAVLGAEALLRWQHPKRGLISPDQFIPLAEESGLIMAIDEWVVKTACLQNKNWQEIGFQPMRVACNLSPREFERPDLARRIRRAVERSGLSPEYLELELTESMMMKNIEQTVALLYELRRYGIRFSIDDFGTGHSSLHYLRCFPVHTLKIDRSFISDLETNTYDAAIAKVVISMAHYLNLEVIAEGVETEEQMRFLSDHDCDKMQGFYYSKPLPAHAMTQLLSDQSQPKISRKSVA